MTSPDFDEDRDLALSQPGSLVKMAAAFTLVGALIGGAGSLQLAPYVSRAIEAPPWVAPSVYGGIFVAPLLAFAGAKLYRLAPWAPVSVIVLGAVGTLLGLAQLAFMLRYRVVVCMGTLGPAALCFGTLVSLVALRSAYASIGARQRLARHGIDLGV